MNREEENEFRSRVQHQLVEKLGRALLLGRTTAEEYHAQLDVLIENTRKWRTENPHKRARVTLNLPEGVSVLVPISTAVRMKFIEANADGLELIKSLWPWDDYLEPSAITIIIALEVEGFI